MPKKDSDRWSRWLQNGRLATIAVAIFVIIWLIPISRPAEFNIVVMGMIGAWFTNVMLSKQKKDAITEKKVEVLQEQMWQEQGRNTDLEKRSVDSERREREPSLHREPDDDLTRREGGDRA